MPTSGELAARILQHVCADSSPRRYVLASRRVLEEDFPDSVLVGAMSAGKNVDMNISTNFSLLRMVCRAWGLSITKEERSMTVSFPRLHEGKAHEGSETVWLGSVALVPAGPSQSRGTCPY
jgi:hypothetical protein